MLGNTPEDSNVVAQGKQRQVVKGVVGGCFGRKVGGYVLGEVLGEGTFGVVRRCTHVESGKDFAVKIVEKKVVRENMWVKKIRREVRIMKELNHNFVVGLKEVLNSRSRIYIIMELVRGGELYWRLQRDGGLEESIARRYFQQLVDAVAYCHKRGVFHRDLKPENLLLCPEDDVLKITDFGLSAIKAEIGGNVMRTACGSPHYVAPEMRHAGGYDAAKVDSWSCGIILYLLLTGWLPFHDENPRALQSQIQNGSVEYTEEIPANAREIIAGLLEKDPVQRWSLSKVRKHPWFRVGYTAVYGMPIPQSSSVAAVEKRANEAITLRARSHTIQSVHELAASTLVAKGSPFAKSVQHLVDGEYKPRVTNEHDAQDGTEGFMDRGSSKRRSFVTRFAKPKVSEKKQRMSFTSRIRSNTFHLFRSKTQTRSSRYDDPLRAFR